MKKTNKGEYKPMAVVHVDANITPSDVAGFLGDPLLTKIKFNYTGEVNSDIFCFFCLFVGGWIGFLSKIICRVTSPKT